MTLRCLTLNIEYQGHVDMVNLRFLRYLTTLSQLHRFYSLEERMIANDELERT
jgi:hypothetical protein